MKFTIAASELTNGLANSLHFVGTEKKHPHLNSINLDTHAIGVVTFTATCRYAVGQVLAETICEEGSIMEVSSGIIPTSAAKELIAFLKPMLKENPPLSVELSNGQIVVTNQATNEASPHALADVAYPPVDKLWPTERMGLNNEVGAVVLDPTIMGRFAKLRDYTVRSWDAGSHLIVGLGEGVDKPIIVTYRDWFRALVKPMKPAPSTDLHNGVDPTGSFPV